MSGLKAASLWVVAVMCVQFMVVWIVTRANKEHFDQYPAAAYFRAVADLAKHKPRAALTIRLCYAASLIEVLLFYAYKHST